MRPREAVAGGLALLPPLPAREGSEGSAIDTGGHRARKGNTARGALQASSRVQQIGICVLKLGENCFRAQHIVKELERPVSRRSPRNRPAANTPKPRRWCPLAAGLPKKVCCNNTGLLKRNRLQSVRLCTTPHALLEGFTWRWAQARPGSEDATKARSTLTLRIDLHEVGAS